MSISGDKYKENLKQAAESLLKGGTLLSEPCEKCNGIQVKKIMKSHVLFVGTLLRKKNQNQQKT